MRNIEGRFESPEDQPNVPWWKELPSEQTVRVLVMAKVPASADEHLSTGEQITQALARSSQAVQGIIDYMEVTPDSFSGIDEESIFKMEYAGGLAMTLTPVHCDNLMQSGLVETIAPDVDLPLIN